MDREIKERIAAINSGIIPEGYKKTKVGIVPVEWEAARFDKIATKFDYGLNAAAKEFDGENKYIRITDIDERSNKYSFSDVVSPDCELDEDYLVEENDILFARTGASTGKTYLYNQDDGKMFFAGFLIRANINIQNNAYFIFSQTLTERYANWVRIFSMRSGQPGINAQEYKSFEILLPPLLEQQKIAEILSTQDKLIELQEKKIEQLKELKKAYLQKMFPQNGSKYPELRFKGFTDPWEQRKLSELFEERNEQAPMSDEYPLMAFIANIGVAPKGDRYDRSALIHDKTGKKYKRTEKGDFIYSSNNLETGSIGLNNYGKACISPVYSIFKSKHTVDPDFMGRILLRKEFIYQMVCFRQGVVYGQWKIHEDDFLNLTILVPKTEEQQKIGTFFSNLDNLITLHQRKSEQEKQKKKALMQLLLTGIVRTK